MIPNIFLILFQTYYIYLKMRLRNRSSFSFSKRKRLWLMFCHTSLNFGIKYNYVSGAPNDRYLDRHKLGPSKRYCIEAQDEPVAGGRRAAPARRAPRTARRCRGPWACAGAGSARRRRRPRPTAPPGTTRPGAAAPGSCGTPPRRPRRLRLHSPHQ